MGFFSHILLICSGELGMRGENGGGGVGTLPTLPTVKISVGTKKFILPPAGVKIAFVIPAKHGEPWWGFFFPGLLPLVVGNQDELVRGGILSITLLIG